LANIADVVEAGPRSLTAADGEAGKERSGSLSTSYLPRNFVLPEWNKTFSPNDFTMKKRTWRNTRSAVPRTSGPRKTLAIRDDVFHQLGINPLHEIHNRALLRDFVSELGRINTRDKTKLTWKNQRKLGQAVRRAKAMGIIPVFSKGQVVAPGTNQNRVMTSSTDLQSLQKAATEVDKNSIPGDSSVF